MLLTKELVSDIVEKVNDHSLRRQRQEDADRWLMYHGKSLEIIEREFKREFKKQETVEQLIKRITPINITQKVINKLSGVYVEDPIRFPVDRSEADAQKLDLYEAAMKVNQRMKEANRHFKQFKTALLEPFVDDEGRPDVRALPKHTYEVFCLECKATDRPNVVVKILNDSQEAHKQVLSIYTDESHIIVNGEKKILVDEMRKLDNADGVNPYGTLPFVFINESSHDVRPIQDDDLWRMAIVIPVLLSDLNYALKFQCWSIIYVIGDDSGDIPFSPNGVVYLPTTQDGPRPEIGTVKPEVDSDKAISMITNLISMLLSTKNLSAGSIKSTIDVNSSASGISKILDNAESMEDKKDQQDYFRHAEYELWMKMAKFMIPYWNQQGVLADEFAGNFSDSFDFRIIFRDPRPVLSEKERIETQKMKLEAGFTTLRRALAEVNTEMTDEELDDLVEEIRQERASRLLEQLDYDDTEDEVEDGVQSEV